MRRRRARARGGRRRRGGSAAAPTAPARRSSAQPPSPSRRPTSRTRGWPSPTCCSRCRSRARSRSRSSGRIEWAGLAVGLAASAKYPGAIAAVPVVVAGWGRWRRSAVPAALAVAGVRPHEPVRAPPRAGGLGRHLARAAPRPRRLARVRERPGRRRSPFSTGSGRRSARCWSSQPSAIVVGLVRRTRTDLILLSFVARLLATCCRSRPTSTATCFRSCPCSPCSREASAWPCRSRSSRSCVPLVWTCRGRTRADPHRHPRSGPTPGSPPTSRTRRPHRRRPVDASARGPRGASARAPRAGTPVGPAPRPRAGCAVQASSWVLVSGRRHRSRARGARPLSARGTVLRASRPRPDARVRRLPGRAGAGRARGCGSTGFL